MMNPSAPPVIRLCDLCGGIFALSVLLSYPGHAAQTQKTSLDDIYIPAKHAAISKVAESEGISEYRLANGLKVLLYPQAGEPVMTVSVSVFVGSRHEGPDESGLAHLLTHLTFKQTSARPDLGKLLKEHDAEFDGASGIDHTTYYVALPAGLENLAVALSLEADRMVNCRFDPPDVSGAVSDVIGEIETAEKNPTAFLERHMTAAAYERSPYAKPVLGTRASLESVSTKDVVSFYERHHRPDNALLVIAGQFDPAAALILIEKYFSTLRPRPTSSRDAARRSDWPDPGTDRPVLLKRRGVESLVGVMYRGPAGSDPDFPAAQALVDLLTANPSGNLHQALVKKGLVTDVVGRADPRAGPGVIQFMAKVRPGKSPETVRDRMIRTLERFAGGRVPEDEVERFRNRALAEYDLALSDGPRVAVGLSLWAAVGDWQVLFRHRENLRRLTVDHVREAAKKYLQPGRRTIGIFTDGPP